ncbi:hypothetical protein ANCCAN_12792, partial [Ancylostoma caninum]
MVSTAKFHENSHKNTALQRLCTKLWIFHQNSSSCPSCHDAAKGICFDREGRSCDDSVPSYETGSMTSLRRNALNPDDECQLPDTKRHKKTSVG